MSAVPKRSYRKNLATTGLIYVNDEEREVSVSNISMSGVLVQFSNESDADNPFNNSLISTIIDFYLPKLHLAGTAEIVRLSTNEESISLALRFKDITYNIDSLLYKRKVYRKNLSVSGQIFLNNEYYLFQTVNVSIEGLMIRLNETVIIAESIITLFEFKDLSLKGEVQVVWVDFDNESRTLVGLKYIHINADAIKGIPRFSTENH